MKRTHSIATGIALSLSLGFAGAAYAHPGQMGQGQGQGMHQGMQGGQGHGMHAGKGRGMQGSNANCDMQQRGANADHGSHGIQGRGNADRQGAQQLMTPEERTAMRDKMRNAATPEERQQIALANRAEMQKRATEKGITLPESRGPRGRGTGPAVAPTAPATPEQTN